MKRIRVLSVILLLLLCACKTEGTEATKPSLPPCAQTVESSLREAAPEWSDTASEPIEEANRASAAPTASPSLDPFAAYFSDVPTLSERGYRSKNVSIRIESYAVDETYGRHVTYHVADIYVRDVTAIRTAAAQGDFGMRYTRTIRSIADDAGALLAIGGDSYTREKNSFVIRNGVLYRDTPIENTDLCILYRDGTMETKRWGTFTAQEIIDSDPWQVWGFGPALLDEHGRYMEIRHRLSGHNPRTAIGYYEPGHYCFVVVDGRGESVGVTLHSLSRLMEDLGCTVAYNLDGGDSAQLYWNGEIISHACNETRVIGDVIYLAREDEPPLSGMFSD